MTHEHGRRQGGAKGALAPPLKIEQALSYLAFYPKITTNRYGSVLRLQTCHASIRLTAVKTEINGFHVKLRASGSTQLHNAYMYSVVQCTLCGFTTLKTNVLSLCARIYFQISDFAVVRSIPVGYMHVGARGSGKVLALNLWMESSRCGVRRWGVNEMGVVGDTDRYTMCIRCNLQP